MKILITAGGTTEPIDTVRGITNFATGKLGKITAEHFLEAGDDVIFFAGQTALIPKPHKRLTIFRISDTQMLYQMMETWVPKVDAVIHSMAVSDYRPVYMTGIDYFPQSLDLKTLLEYRPEKKENKISSKAPYQVMLLEKTPKIISQVKKWHPKVILVGFKLLSGVSQAHLIDIAQQKGRESRADFIVANDLTQVTKEKHRALILDHKQNIVAQLETKDAIAKEIVRKTHEKSHE